MKAKNSVLIPTALLIAALTSACGRPSGGSERGPASSGVITSEDLSAKPADFPILHKIETYTFQAPYGCAGSYEKSALFLSAHSKQQNGPDLLFNGACGSPLYIEASTAGDDMSLISDLGTVSLETVSASKAFNYERTVGYDNTFRAEQPVAAGHTYSVLITKSDIRALLVLHVDAIVSGQMKISYAVKTYSIQGTTKEAPGFNWDQGNK